MSYGRRILFSIDLGDQSSPETSHCWRAEVTLATLWRSKARFLIILGIPNFASIFGSFFETILDQFWVHVGITAPNYVMTPCCASHSRFFYIVADIPLSDFSTKICMSSNPSNKALNVVPGRALGNPKPCFGRSFVDLKDQFS